MTLPTYTNVTIHEYKENRFTEEEILISAEYPVTLMINGSPYTTFSCSGTELESYARGHLTTEGIIKGPSDIQSIEIDETNLTIDVRLIHNVEISEKLNRIKTLTAAGGRSRKELPGKELIRKNLPSVSADVILKCINEFLTYSKERDLTSGVHGSALYTLNGEMLAFFNDIGRHNAIDKTIGYAVMNNISFEDIMIFSSGRISSEIALKIINSHTPILVSRASPTTYSMQLLKDYNIITISRILDGCFYVINGKEQIIK